MNFSAATLAIDSMPNPGMTTYMVVVAITSSTATKATTSSPEVTATISSMEMKEMT
jgi:hypothetical protein